MKLSSLNKGEKGIVKALDEHELSSRLLDMGFYEGQHVKVLFSSPFGDPISVEVGQTMVSIRKKEADLVILEE